MNALSPGHPLPNGRPAHTTRKYDNRYDSERCRLDPGNRTKVGFFCAFSFGLGFGVTYNAQTIALSERGRELATLRVLGFTRRESLYIVTGEILLRVLVSLPLGCLLGYGLTALFVNAPGYNTELMRITLAIRGSTYDVSVLVLLAAGLVAGATIKRRVDGALRARVRRVEPFGFTKVSALGIEEQRVNVVLDIVSPRADWQRLAHGYQTDVRIVLWQGDAVLRVPLTALFRNGDGWALFVSEDDRAVLRDVRVGHRTDRDAEILEGLAAGEVVVVYPGEEVEEGARLARRS